MHTIRQYLFKDNTKSKIVIILFEYIERNIPSSTNWIYYIENGKDDSKNDSKITVHHAELLDDGDKGWTVDLDPNVPLPA